MALELEIPRKLLPLLEPKRYKGVHGGRGSSKSHTFAQLACASNYSRPLRGVCIREIQSTIRDSSKQLIEDKISGLGLDGHFRPLDTEIRGSNGSLILFRGMQSFNAENIKSLEGMDWAWIDEAQNLSARSWRMLRPTIRKPGSEIWCSWNPRHDTDAVDEFFRGKYRNTDSQTCIEMNWDQNPWFPDVLRDEMRNDYAVDQEMAEHVWGGGYEIITEGAYYARLIADAEREGRVGNFPYDKRQRLFTSWDLGVSDYTAVWFMQDDGHRITVVDYYEASGQGAEDVVSAVIPEQFIAPSIGIEMEPRWLGWSREKALEEIGRDEPFHYTGHYLPHDVRVREWGAGARSRVQILTSLGLRNISKGVAAAPEDRIAAVRRLLPRVRFHASPRVLHGLSRLRRYRRRLNEQMGLYLGPMHDEASHAADAFGEYAVNCEIMPAAPPKPAAAPTKFDMVRDEAGNLRPNMTAIEYARMKQRLKEMQNGG